MEKYLVAIDAESEGNYLLASNMLLDLIEKSNEEVGYTEVSNFGNNNCLIVN
jgi:hypothetical protein